MKSSRQLNVGWGLTLVVVCMAVVLAPCSRAYFWGGDDYSDPYGTVIGIDIGSETSRVAVMRDGKLDVLDRIPSCVAFTDTGILVGNEAKLQRINNPSRTICDVRMLVGQKWSDPNLQEAIKGLHYRVQEKGDKPAIAVNIQGREYTYTPENIAGIVMSKLRDNAAKKIGEEVTHAVVSVPTSFNNDQRQAIKDAGATVGLGVLRIINESSAAVIAYDLDRMDDELSVVVLDLGASKTDVTVLEIDQGVIEVLATASTPISGRLSNRQLVEYIAAQCTTEGILLDQQARIEMEEGIEAAQRNRSFSLSAYCLSSDFTKHCTGLTSSKTKSSTGDLDRGLVFDSVLEPLKHALENSNRIIEWEESWWNLKEEMPYIPSNITNVDRVIAVGGFSKSPMVAGLLDALRRNNSWTDLDFDADEAVVKGAAIQALVLSGPEFTSGMVTYVVVSDLGLGLETSEGYIHNIIQRYTVLPTRKVRNLTTSSDDQDSMLIRVLEGDRMTARNNSLLGEVKLTGIPPAPRHVPIVEVSFELDENGILNVSAHCLGTNIEASAIFKNTTLYRMLRDPDFEQTYFDAEFDDPEPISKARLEHHIKVVEWIMDREDVVETPGTLDAPKEDAQRKVQETKAWLATQSDVAPLKELNYHNMRLWVVARELLNFNLRGRMYSVGAQAPAVRKSNEP